MLKTSKRKALAFYSIMISIIVPVYNEEENIGEVLEGLTCNNGSEIIVVDGRSEP